METPLDRTAEINLDELPVAPPIELRAQTRGRPLGLVKLGPLDHALGYEQAREFVESIAPCQDAQVTRNRILARQVLTRFARG